MAELIELGSPHLMLAHADGDDRLSAFRTDMDFHCAIVAAAKNPQLVETHAGYNARLWRVLVALQKQRQQTI